MDEETERSIVDAFRGLFPHFGEDIDPETLPPLLCAICRKEIDYRNDEPHSGTSRLESNGEGEELTIVAYAYCANCRPPDEPPPKPGEE